MRKTIILIFLLFIPFCTFSQDVFAERQINNIKAKEISEGIYAKNNCIDSLINLCITEINQDSIKRTIRDLQNFGTRYMLAPNHRDVAVWLQNRFISSGCTNTVLDSLIMVTNLPGSRANDTSMQYNVIATRTGNVNPGNVYMAGGHYDDMTYVTPMSFAPGADDDASGIAATIEIARVMNKIGFAPASTIKFAAFAGEEAMISYSDEWGSQHYVADAVYSNENIILFITNDMIAYNPDSTNRKLKINTHATSGWAGQLADEICRDYTNLDPVQVLLDMETGADDLPFARSGIPSVYVAEYYNSPYWHKESDTLENCNMAYCAEAIKITAGMLIKASESPLNIKDLFIVNPGDGHSLHPTWKPNTENDLEGYKLYVGTSPGAYDTVIVTTDTSYYLGNLLPDTVYYIGVTAFNNKGTESAIVEKSDAPGLVTLSQGILIVKDSEGGISNPDEQQIDEFYNMVCDGFNHSQYDATSTNKISLGLIGKYSSLLWYVNNPAWPLSILKNYRDLLRNYLNHGGHILFTLYKPSLFLENNTANENKFSKGSFMFDCANIDSVTYSIYSRFSGAKPDSAGLDLIWVDSLKAPPGFNYHLPFIEAISPAQNGRVIYLFDSKYDSTSSQGSFINRSVGIENNGPDKNVITVSFPLYYMKTEQAKDFVYHVMSDKFHENYSGINEESQKENNDILVYPNPAVDQIIIIISDEQDLNLLIYNVVGEPVLQKEIKKNTNKIDISSLTRGLYIIKVLTEDRTVQKKLVKE